MSLIKCPECGAEVSDKAKKCIHCGYPFRTTAFAGNQADGKVVFKSSNDFIGIGKYIVKDRDGNVVAKLKANDCAMLNIDKDTRFYVRYNGAFTTFKEVLAPVDKTSKFLIGLAAEGFDFYVREI